jgi:hypothetical protein
MNLNHFYFASFLGNFYILFIAQSILGIGNALVYVPVIPDMIDTLQRRFENIS